MHWVISAFITRPADIGWSQDRSPWHDQTRLLGAGAGIEMPPERGGVLGFGRGLSGGWTAGRFHTLEGLRAISFSGDKQQIHPFEICMSQCRHGE